MATADSEGTYVALVLQAPFSTGPVGVHVPLTGAGEALAEGDAAGDAAGDALEEGVGAGEVPGGALGDGGAPGQSVKSPLFGESVGGRCEMPSSTAGVVSTSWAAESSR